MEKKLGFGTDWWIFMFLANFLKYYPYNSKKISDINGCGLV